MNREVQTFHIETDEFFKFIKVSYNNWTRKNKVTPVTFIPFQFEVTSSYGNNYFCPISLFRIYGLTELEVVDQLEGSDDTSDLLPLEDEQEDEKPKGTPRESSNLFLMF